METRRKWYEIRNRLLNEEEQQVVPDPRMVVHHLPRENAKRRLPLLTSERRARERMKYRKLRQRLRMK